MRCAAASVSFMTCGRGRGFGLDAGVDVAGVDFAGVDFVCVMSVMWSDPGRQSMPAIFSQTS
jgi:hypothetical protein